MSDNFIYRAEKLCQEIREAVLSEDEIAERAPLTKSEIEAYFEIDYDWIQELAAKYRIPLNMVVEYIQELENEYIQKYAKPDITVENICGFILDPTYTKVTGVAYYFSDKNSCKMVNRSHADFEHYVDVANQYMLALANDRKLDTLFKIEYADGSALYLIPREDVRNG